MNFYIGIDPGASSGAIALISSDYSVIRSARHPKSIPACVQLVKDYIQIAKEMGGKVVLAVLEKVSAMPKQGVSSMFKFGADFGMWQGILAALMVPYILVTPTVWQRGVLDSTTRGDKMVTLDYVRRRFPEHELKFKADNGRADAICMGQYGKKKQEGQL